MSYENATPNFAVRILDKEGYAINSVDLASRGTYNVESISTYDSS
jgi:hypothetical protein